MSKSIYLVLVFGLNNIYWISPKPVFIFWSIHGPLIMVSLIAAGLPAQKQEVHEEKISFHIEKAILHIL